MTPQDEIAALKKEVRALKQIIFEMKEAMKLLTEKDDRAKAFIERIESLAAALVIEKEEKEDEMDHLSDK